ncbi:MAG: hypothetical protein ACI30S_03635 [Muribaculaceae bacterium]
MKKFLQLILVALCVATAAQVYAKTIYFCPSEDWSTQYGVKCHHWGGSTNATTWPGETMSVDEETGLYYINIPDDRTGVKINARNAENTDGTDGSQFENDNLQDNAVYDASGVWYSSIDAYKADLVDIYYDNSFSTWEKVHVYPLVKFSGNKSDWAARVPFGKWPGKEITKGEELCYKIKVPNGAKVFFDNGNSGEGNQSQEITVSDSKIYYYSKDKHGELPLAVYAIGSNLQIFGDAEKHHWQTNWKGENELMYKGAGAFEIDYLVVGKDGTYTATETDKDGKVWTAELEFGSIRFVTSPSTGENDWNLGTQYYPSSYDGSVISIESEAKEFYVATSTTNGVENWKFRTEESMVSKDGVDFSSYSSYHFTLDLANNKLIVAGTTGVESVSEDDVNAPVEYFNLQGVRVENPQNGLYIVRQGNKVSKQIIR